MCRKVNQHRPNIKINSSFFRFYTPKWPISSGNFVKIILKIFSFFFTKSTCLFRDENQIYMLFLCNRRVRRDVLPRKVGLFTLRNRPFHPTKPMRFAVQSGRVCRVKWPTLRIEVGESEVKNRVSD